MSKQGRRLPPSKTRAAILDNALAAVMVGKLPDVRGEETLGTVKTFDPYEERAWRDGHSARPVARVKVLSLRDDPSGGYTHAARSMRRNMPPGGGGRSTMSTQRSGQSGRSIQRGMWWTEGSCVIR